MTDPTPQAVSVCKWCDQPITDRWSKVWVHDAGGCVLHIRCFDGEHNAEPADPSPAPQTQSKGEMPTAFDQSRGWEAIIKWAYANNDDGVLAVRDIAREFVDWRTRAQTAESALTTMREERDRAQDALRAIRLRVNRQFAVKTIDEYFALKPVPDRQPEGETK